VGVDLGVIGMLMIWRTHLVIQQECPYEHSCSMGVEMSGGSFSGVWMSIMDSCLGIFLGGDAMVFGWVGDRLRCSRAWRIALLNVASRCWRMSCGIALAMAEWMIGVSSDMIEHFRSSRFSGDRAGLLWMAARVLSVLSCIS
jgi:hypothetical protein